MQQKELEGSMISSGGQSWIHKFKVSVMFWNVDMWIIAPPAAFLKKAINTQPSHRHWNLSTYLVPSLINQGSPFQLHPEQLHPPSVPHMANFHHLRPKL